MKGIFIDCINGKKSEVELGYEVIWINTKRVFQLLNGVTGDKFFDIRYDIVYIISKHGWRANVGIEGVQGDLFIPAEEMKKVFEKEGLI